jgi:hypothetical protein
MIMQILVYAMSGVIIVVVIVFLGFMLSLQPTSQLGSNLQNFAMPLIL